MNSGSFHEIGMPQLTLNACISLLWIFQRGVLLRYGSEINNRLHWGYCSLVLVLFLEFGSSAFGVQGCNLYIFTIRCDSATGLPIFWASPPLRHQLTMLISLLTLRDLPQITVGISSAGASYYFVHSQDYGWS